MRKSVQVLAVVGVVALAASACGSKPQNTASGGGSAFKACMVTDTGGIDDRSFNASAWKGMQDAEKGGKVRSSNQPSASENDYVPNINALIKQKCGIVVSVGGLMSDATKTAAQANKDQKFAIVDASYNPTLPNVFGMEFNTAQAAFMGGYLAAAMTKTGKVATYGGIKIAPVTIYMDGFWEGVQYYNKQKGKNVEVLGWDETKQDGTFANSFTDQNKGKQISNNFIQQGADIIMPAAGQAGLGAGAAAEAAGGKLNLIWVDFDGCESAPQYCRFFVSSVEKNIPAIVTEIVEKAASGNFAAGTYVGTLDNNGTSLAPFHEFDGKVPADIKSDLDQIQKDIVGGTIKITSPAQPKG